jgi:hypothetical protein
MNTVWRIALLFITTDAAPPEREYPQSAVKKEKKKDTNALFSSKSKYTKQKEKKQQRNFGK